MLAMVVTFAWFLVEHQSRYLLSIPFCCDTAKACAQHFCARHPSQSQVTSPATPLTATWWGRSAEKLPTENHWVAPFKGPRKTWSLWRIVLALPIIPCRVKAGRPESLGSSSTTSISWCSCSVSCGCELVCSVLVSDVDVYVDEDFLLGLLELPDSSEDKSSDSSLLRLALQSLQRNFSLSLLDSSRKSGRLNFANSFLNCRSSCGPATARAKSSCCSASIERIASMVPMKPDAFLCFLALILLFVLSASKAKNLTGISTLEEMEGRPASRQTFSIICFFIISDFFGGESGCHR